MKIALTGASGFVGSRFRALAAERGHEVLALKRLPGDGGWEPFEGADAVVHLAGEPVASGRWTSAKMERIRKSRVAGTRRLVERLRAAGPKVLVSASAIGYYGDRGEETLTEDSAPGSDFLAEVCRGWEEESRRAPCRSVQARISLVLGPGGGALAKMLVPFKLGLGGTMAGGRHWMSWIHLDDLAALLLHAVEREDLSGPLLACTPHPVTNLEFTKTLGRVLGRPTILPMPYFQIRLLFGKVASLLTASQRCRPERTLASGFAFRRPLLEEALRAILVTA
jgi:uncharacterized protein (TIGR01777 family)